VLDNISRTGRESKRANDTEEEGHGKRQIEVSLRDDWTQAGDAVTTSRVIFWESTVITGVVSGRATTGECCRTNDLPSWCPRAADRYCNGLRSA